jgi:DnaJ-class molecular chaperone
MNKLIVIYNNETQTTTPLEPLSISTTPANITRAYRRLALHFHTDKSGGNASNFQDLNNNNDILKRKFQIAGKKKRKMHKLR